MKRIADWPASGRASGSGVAVACSALVAMVLLGSALLGGCSRGAGKAAGEAAEKGPVVARVGDQDLRVDDLGARFRPESVAQRRQLVDAAVARVLAADEARRRGVNAQPEVAARLDAIRRQARALEEATLRDALFASLEAEQKVSDEDVRKAYEKNKAHYRERQLELRWYPAASEAAAEALAKELGQGAAGKKPAASPAPEEIGPAGLSHLPAKVLPQALRLRHPGDRTVAGSAAAGWGVVELVKILPSEPMSYEDVHDRLAQALRIRRAQEQFHALVDKLRAKEKVEISDAVLADDSAWGSVPAPPGGAARVHRARVITGPGRASLPGEGPPGGPPAARP